MTKDQYLNSESRAEGWRTTLCILLFVFMIVAVPSACSVQAHIESKPTAPAATAASAPASGPIGVTVLLGVNGDCSTYRTDDENNVHVVYFVNCKTGTTAVKGN